MKINVKGRFVERNTRTCDICGREAVDVWVDPKNGQILWVCKYDLYDLEQIFRLASYME